MTQVHLLISLSIQQSLFHSLMSNLQSLKMTQIFIHFFFLHIFNNISFHQKSFSFSVSLAYTIVLNLFSLHWKGFCKAQKLLCMSIAFDVIHVTSNVCLMLYFIILFHGESTKLLLLLLLLSKFSLLSFGLEIFTFPGM